MLYGIGCDLCEVARMEKSLSGAHGPAFVRRVFGPAEQAALGLSAEAEPWPAGRASPISPRTAPTSSGPMR